MMTRKLGDDDAHAVDLLIDRTTTATGSTDGDGARNAAGVYVTPVGDSVARRIGAVESVLRLIAEMPASDPPVDLVARTLERIERRGAASITGAQPQPEAVIGQGPQHA